MALFVVLGVLVARLFQVQVLEHRVWAAEAASLVRTSQVVPGKRGRILDRDGRVLVEDEEVWRVDFVYRDFRRRHPLGIVAHARSTLENRAVPCAEALARLEDWAIELVSLSAADLAGFRAGRALRTASFAVPATADAKLDLRAARASDLRYYQETLLGAGQAERIWVRDRKPDPSLPYFETIAAARGVSSATLLASLKADLGSQRERLADLARLLPARPGDREAGGLSLEALLARIEAARTRFEDAAADALFEKATGFSAGRISTAALSRAFDLAWIARSLRWDAARLAAWTGSRRAAYETDVDEIELPRILVRAGLEDDDRVVESLLDGLASRFASEEDSPSWRETSRLCVLDRIPELFELEHAPDRVSRGADAALALPFLEQDFRDAAPSIEDPWLLLGTLAEMAGARSLKPAASNAREWAALWRGIASTDDHLEGEEARRALGAILSALEARFVAACDAAIEACFTAGAAERARVGPLPLARDGLERAEQEERFLIKDISSRPVRMAGDADYALVHLLERDADRYRGFEVGPATRRKILVRDGRGVPIAHGLIGGVRGPSLREILADERRRGSGGPAFGEEAAEIASRILRSDEKSGVSGVEAMFDRELRARNGWLESTSLDEERSEGFFRPAVDGQDVRLTLAADLQLAAEETLEHPQVPAGAATDAVWLQNPVGAIVLLTTDGEVLAAASVPTQDGLPPAPDRDLERTHARERTLTRPVFNPPGSSIKPFVAAYALDRLGLDPKEEFRCGPLDESDGGGFGYGDRYGKMRCHVGGHGSSDVSRALAVSCNATFAQIGERFSSEQLLEMADLFGFGRATGIRNVPSDEAGPRRGIREDAELAYKPKLPKTLGAPQHRMRFANGLSVIEASPMQIARAMAGLVTGKLPEVRLVLEVGGSPVGKVATDLPISARARETVLRALEGVIEQEGGTAHGKDLDRASLGFSFVCKTGSADTWDLVKPDGSTSERKDGQKKMRKQTWIAGWFPKENPRAILVVLLHDVSEVSTQTSVYVAGQFLRTSAVKRFLEETR